MRRLLFFLPVPVALVAVSCASGEGPGAPAAATVNGSEVSRSTLDAELAALAAYPTYAQVLLREPLQGVTEGTYNTTAVAGVLTDLVIDRLIAEDLEQRGVHLSDEDREEVLRQLHASLGGPEVFEEFPDEQQQRLVDRVASSQAIADAVAGDVGPAEVTEADVRSFYDENQDAFSEACVSHILIGTDARDVDEATLIASELKADLDGGADFAQLAGEQSDDPGSAAAGGDLGCQPRGVYVPEFEEVVWSIEPGEVSDPVVSDFGVHLIIVDERTTRSFEEAEGEIEESLVAQSQAEAAQVLAGEFEAWLQEALLSAEVTVDPRYGTWEMLGPDGLPTDDPEAAITARVVPPEGPVPSPDAPAVPGPGGLPSDLPE